MRKIFKKMTIRSRAYKLGCELKRRHAPGFLVPSLDNDNWRSCCRTLIRLNRIKHGIKPFAKTDPNGVKIGDVYECESALRKFGNIK